MPAPLLRTLRITSRTRRFVPSLASVFITAILAIGLLAHAPQHASAETTAVTQCNDDTTSNQGGQGIACTVTIVNYMTAAGGIDTARPSTVTVTRCTGPAGFVATGAGTCVTHTTTSAGPIASVRQCNGSGNGGGGVVMCSTTVTNYFSGSPATAPTAATVYQCAGSVVTGTGASGMCIPADSPQTTSATGATIAQCNGSGNGGPHAGFICSVTGGSTTTAALPVHVEQCNGSGNGGGALMNCRATVMHVIARLPVTLAVTPAAARLAAPAAASRQDIPPQALSVQAAQAPPSPPATGNAGLATRSAASHSVVAGAWLLGIAALALVPGGRWLVARRATQ